MKEAYLVLEDGKVFPGIAFGVDGVTVGELIFNTCMTGYEEVLTDPANHGNIVTMTYPEIGNVGVNAADAESARPQIAGLVVRSLSAIQSNYRCEKSLDQYLVENGIVAIRDVDTRAVAKYIRDNGCMKAVIACGERLSVADLVALAQNAPSTIYVDSCGCENEGCEDEECSEDHECCCGHHDDGGEGCSEACGEDHECCCGHKHENPFLKTPNLIAEVTCAEPYQWTEKHQWIDERVVSQRKKVVVLDLGVCRNQLRYLVSFGCDVTVVPATTSAEEILALNPDGVYISNGPGAPWVGGIIDNSIADLIGKVPIFAVGLGHVMTGMALGLCPCLLEHGHHGANIPVQNTQTGHVTITSQNNKFAISTDDIEDDQVEVTEVNLNFPDIIEGFRHKSFPIMSITWTPGAPTRAQDGTCLFDEFMAMMQ